MNYQLYFVLILFLVLTILMFSGKFRISTVAVLCAVCLQASGILTFQEAWAGLINESTVMMAAMFIVGHGLSKTSLVSRLSRSFIKPGSSDTKIMFGLFVVIFLLSCVVNGTAIIIIMVPIIYSVCKENNRPVSKFMQTCTILAGIWAGCLPTGGNAAGYLQQNAIIEQLGGAGNFGYFTQMLARLPVVIVCAVVGILFAHKLAPSFDADYMAETSVNSKGSQLDPLHEKMAIIIFILTLAGVIIAALAKYSVSVPAVFGAIAMVMLGIISGKEVPGCMQIGAILVFVGMLPLATALAKTGGDVIIADNINKLLGGTTNSYVVLGLLFLCTSVLTQFLSNGAVGAIFRPIAVILAVQNGWDTTAMVIAVVMGCGCCMCTPMASPAMAIGYEAGKYNMKQYFKGGLLLWLVEFAVFMLWVPFAYPIV